MHRIAISGLVALATVLGGAAARGPPWPSRLLVHGRSSRSRPCHDASPAGAEAADADIRRRLAEHLVRAPATDCLAVRAVRDLSGVGTYTPTRVDRWNGSSWKRLGVTLPARTTSVDLNGVSCRGTRFCLVVGDYYKSTKVNAASSPLVLVYNGTSLRPISAMPLPKGQPNVTLTGVSCATTRDCVAVGLANGNPVGLNRYSDGISFIEMWNGVRWALRTIVSSETMVAAPSAVSCATASFCVLMGEVTSVSNGYADVGPDLGWWNGRRLTRTPAPAASAAPTARWSPPACRAPRPANCAWTGSSSATRAGQRHAQHQGIHAGLERPGMAVGHDEVAEGVAGVVPVGCVLLRRAFLRGGRLRRRQDGLTAG